VKKPSNGCRVPNFDPYIAKCWDWTPMALCLYNVPSSDTVVNNSFINAGGVSATGVSIHNKNHPVTGLAGMANLWRLNLCGVYLGFKVSNIFFPPFLGCLGLVNATGWLAFFVGPESWNDLNLSTQSLSIVSFDYGRFNWTKSSVDKKAAPW